MLKTGRGGSCGEMRCLQYTGLGPGGRRKGHQGEKYGSSTEKLDEGMLASLKVYLRIKKLKTDESYISEHWILCLTTQENTGSYLYLSLITPEHLEGRVQEVKIYKNLQADVILPPKERSVCIYII